MPTATAAPDLAALAAPPAGVAETFDLVAKFDACLLAGFGRLGPDQTAALASLGRAIAGSPLGDTTAKAIQAISTNEFQPAHFAALAAARSALLGAAHDALLDQVRTALGRPHPEAAAAPPPCPAAPHTLCDSTRQWLAELAITGFKQLDAATLAPFASTLDNLQADPNLARLASLLTGLQHELLLALPIGRAAPIPTQRWADLWARAMLTTLCCEKPAQTAGQKVSGTLTALGVDLRQHATFASAVVYGLLDVGGEKQIVRTTLNSWKVDALQGGEIWRTFAQPAHLPLLKAISDRVPLAIKNATLLPAGDLLWDGEAKESGKPVDPYSIAAEHLAPGATTRFPGTDPLDRHPIQLAELVHLEGVSIKKSADGLTVTLPDGGTLPVMTQRLPAGSELSTDDVATATSIIGLLRYDARQWQIQPLTVRPGANKDKKLAAAGAQIGSAAYASATKKPKKGEPNTLAILQERASRLLRKKS